MTGQAINAESALRLTHKRFRGSKFRDRMVCRSTQPKSKRSIVQPNITWESVQGLPLPKILRIRYYALVIPYTITIQITLAKGYLDNLREL